MKFIHCSDLHLASPCAGCKNPAKRQKELFTAFERVVSYAVKNDVEAILVAGDVFDNDYCSTSLFDDFVFLLNDSQLKFFFVSGNHGGAHLYKKLKEKTVQNCYFFDKEFSSVVLGNVNVCGFEPSQNDSWQNVQADESKFNVLLLHCDVDSDAYGRFDRQKASSFQYVALGHRHTHAKMKLKESIVCYSGVLEPRGFDESGDCGFVVVDTQKNTVKFVSDCKRKVEHVQVDCNGVSSFAELKKLVQKATFNHENYVNLKIVGTVNLSVDVKRLQNELCDDVFALRIEDCTNFETDLERLKNTSDLLSKFLSLTQALPNDEQKQVVRLGIKAMLGEDLR